GRMSAVSMSSLLSMSIERYGRARKKSNVSVAVIAASAPARRPPTIAAITTTSTRISARLVLSTSSRKGTRATPREIGPSTPIAMPTSTLSCPGARSVMRPSSPNRARISGVAEHTYQFRSVWRPAAPVADVYTVLEHLADYPMWWPEVKEVRPLRPDEHEREWR